MSHAPEQLRYCQPECLRNLLDIDQSHVAFTPFDPADVGPVQLAHICESLLGHAQFLPSLAQTFAKPDSNIFHLPLSVILKASGFMCPRTMSIIDTNNDGV